MLREDESDIRFLFHRFKIDRRVMFHHVAINVNIFEQGKDVLIGLGENFDRFEITREEFESWIDIKKTGAKNIADVLRSVRQMMVAKDSKIMFKLILNVPEKKVLELLPEVHERDGLEVLNEKLSKGTINKIIDESSKLTYLSFPNLKFPKGFNHNQPIPCWDVTYGNAFWVKVDHILALRESGTITLRNTDWHSQMINRLLVFWITADFRMFQRLRIHTRSKFLINKLFNGVETLQVDGSNDVMRNFHSREGSSYFVILSTSMRIAFIQVADKHFEMLTALQGDYKEYARMIIMLMEKRRKEKELRSLEEKLDNLNIQFSSGRAQMSNVQQ
uniref:FBA_2 domain-containing protein n=1 Tax=Caenorhabditis tropicalis TaxID=1561998 RepID=A0A1I7UDP8_9PELO